MIRGGTTRMDRRNARRLEMEFSVRVWGVDRHARPFAELVRATRISANGAVLLDIHSKVQPGDVLDVQHEARQAQFKIIWTQPGEIGIQAMATEPAIFAGPATLEMTGTG
jgi:hypothetical protein